MGTRVQIGENISGVKYLNLLFSIRNEVKFCSLVLRDSMYKTPTINKFISNFQRNLVETKKTKEWPGTKLEGPEEATLFMYSVCETLWAEVVKVNSFKGWVYPNRLEDLCFYDANKNLILGSKTHQNEVFYAEDLK